MEHEDPALCGNPNITGLTVHPARPAYVNFHYKPIIDMLAVTADIPLLAASPSPLDAPHYEGLGQITPLPRKHSPSGALGALGLPGHTGKNERWSPI